MAYGANRTSVATDTFAAGAIGAEWDNGKADWMVFQDGGADIIANTSDSQIQRNTGTYTDDHYSKATYTLIQGSGWSGCSVRGASGATDESCYHGIFFQPTGDNDTLIEEINSSFGFSTLANGGAPSGTFTAGESLTLEAEGTALRLGEDFDGSDGQDVATTDGTLTTGMPGITGAGEADVQVSAWEGGSIGAVGGTNPKGPLGNPFFGPFGGAI